ncbi:MAG TPA: phosphodiester glycosidase family protein [Solirubrobacteraceae bacterium]|nr:phosphodiester glycosidase family protein [Solirubrobacteraceae bacterium]
MASAPAPRPRRAGQAESIRVSGTTLHVVAHPLESTEVRVVRLRTPAPLAAWCARNAIAEAIVGGFFVRGGKHDFRPLGELRTRGIRRRTVPFDTPWSGLRACVASAGGELRLDRRPELPARPRGDLLQAGPLLVRDGRPILDDPEGFSAGAHQFDSDITAGRYPRAALAIAADRILAVACDGRADDEAGLTLADLAHALADLGATHAINLDGGGSTSLVSGGELRNVPREEHGVVLAGGRRIPTALAFLPR